jgi:uncharacterized OsmC-like protein
MSTAVRPCRTTHLLSESSSVKAMPTSYQLTARIARPGVSIGRTKGATIEFDTSATGGDQLPGPADLLTLAFAACVLKNVERFSQMLRFSYRTTSIEVTSERQDVPPRMTKIAYSLLVDTDEPQHRVDLLHRNIRQHGTIYNTMAAVCEVTGSVSVGREDEDPALVASTSEPKA